MKNRALLLSATLLAITLTGCGGGSSSNNEPSVPATPAPLSEAPTVSASAKQYALAGESVQLIADASDDEAGISYQWSQITGNEVIITDSNASTATFIAPELTNEETLEFQVTVSDTDQQEAQSTVQVIINSHSALDKPITVSIPTIEGLDLTDEDKTFLITIGGKTVELDDPSAITLATEPKAAEPIVLTNELGKPVLMAMSSTENGAVEVSIESSAEVFVMRSPRFYGARISDYSELSRRIRSHDLFPKVVEAIAFEIKIESPCPMKASCNGAASIYAAEVSQDIDFSDLIAQGE